MFISLRTSVATRGELKGQKTVAGDDGDAVREGTQSAFRLLLLLVLGNSVVWHSKT